jgi:hypothetical protein
MSRYTAVKSVLLQSVRPCQIISFDRNELTDVLLSFGQNDLSFGLGQHICYDFAKIEAELTNLLVHGKAYLILDDSFPSVVYSCELFVTSASVLREIKHQLVQRPLTRGMITRIIEKKDGHTDYIQVMMRQTEVLLSLVKKTGVTCDQSLDSFIHTLHTTLPSGFSANKLFVDGESLHLSHLVALYECLESLYADIIVDTLNDNLLAPLSGSAREEIFDFLKRSKLPLVPFETALKRFIVRYLINFEVDSIDLEQPLAFWMIEPSLWPDDDVGSDKMDDLLTSVTKEFPQSLNLNHAHGILMILREMTAVSRFFSSILVHNRLDFNCLAYCY